MQGRDTKGRSLMIEDETHGVWRGPSWDRTLERVDGHWTQSSNVSRSHQVLSAKLARQMQAQETLMLCREVCFS
jgi:hypothetical protein